MLIAIIGMFSFHLALRVFILSFEGEWASDWYITDEEARKNSPLYDNLLGDQDLKTQRTHSTLIYIIYIYTLIYIIIKYIYNIYI